MKRNRQLVNTFIQGNCFAGSIRAMLAANDTFEFRPAKDVTSADMILYTGGSDINPALYGENKLDCTWVDTNQDKEDGLVYHEGKKLGKFQVGICRGAQLLNVLNGGSMWQDVNNHGGREHLVQDVLTKKTYLVSSLHHQGIILNPQKSQLLAFCEESTRKISAKGAWREESGRPSTDVEAFYYPETRSLGVQWHPECGPRDCINLFFNYIERYINLDSNGVTSRTEGASKDITQEVDRAVG